MTTHTLKTEAEFFDAVKSGEKTFEVRYNDRGFQKGDILHLERCNQGVYAGGHLLVRVTYVLSGWGLKDGFVALGVRVVSEEGK